MPPGFGRQGPPIAQPSRLCSGTITRMWNSAVENLARYLRIRARDRLTLTERKESELFFHRCYDVFDFICIPANELLVAFGPDPHGLAATDERLLTAAVEQLAAAARSNSSPQTRVSRMGGGKSWGGLGRTGQTRKP